MKILSSKEIQFLQSQTKNYSQAEDDSGGSSSTLSLELLSFINLMTDIRITRLSLKVKDFHSLLAQFILLKPPYDNKSLELNSDSSILQLTDLLCELVFMFLPSQDVTLQLFVIFYKARLNSNSSDSFVNIRVKILSEVFYLFSSYQYIAIDYLFELLLSCDSKVRVKFIKPIKYKELALYLSLKLLDNQRLSRENILLLKFIFSCLEQDNDDIAAAAAISRNRRQQTQAQAEIVVVVEPERQQIYKVLYSKLEEFIQKERSLQEKLNQLAMKSNEDSIAFLVKPSDTTTLAYREFIIERETNLYTSIVCKDFRVKNVLLELHRCRVQAFAELKNSLSQLILVVRDSSDLRDIIDSYEFLVFKTSKELYIPSLIEDKYRCSSSSDATTTIISPIYIKDTITPDLNLCRRLTVEVLQEKFDIALSKEEKIEKIIEPLFYYFFALLRKYKADYTERIIADWCDTLRVIAQTNINLCNDTKLEVELSDILLDEIGGGRHLTFFENKENVHLLRHLDKTLLRFLELNQVSEPKSDLKKIRLPKEDEPLVSFADQVSEELKKYCCHADKDSVSRQRLALALDRVAADSTKFQGLLLIDILQKVYHYMDSQDEREFLFSRLSQELVEAEGTCSSGFLARIMNSLSGFKGFTIDIDPLEELYGRLKPEFDIFIVATELDEQLLEEKKNGLEIKLWNFISSLNWTAETIITNPNLIKLCIDRYLTRKYNII